MALAVFTKQEVVEIFGGNEGTGILDYITRNQYGGREYLVDGVWRKTPEGRISGYRYDVEDFAVELVDITAAWKFIKDSSIENPAKPDKILEQLALARLQQGNLQIFSPWGPRYKKNTAKIVAGDPEIDTLREINQVFGRLVENNYKIRFLLMPADTYGTEINGLDKNFVKEYFKCLENAAYSELAKVADVEVMPWSRITEICKSYEEIKREIEVNFSARIGDSEYERAVNTARRFNPRNAEQSARKYCIERATEAEIIQSLYEPIKMSLVRKEKDSLDGPLKRIYIIGKRAPWLRGDN